VCGIVGQWRLDGAPVVEADLVRARDTMLTRGPDDCGIWIDGNIGLGHRRLSIIDLSPAGRMPMSNEDGTIWSVFNGEIYNFADLKRELLAKGHTFRSGTDSEVVIHAYEEWGTSCFDRFDGMFALAIWDGGHQRLVLARDITGEKPLFYRWVATHSLAFGSTLSSLLALSGASRSLDADAVRAYAQFGYVPTPHSIIAGVHKVPPGSFVEIGRDQAPLVERYWNLESAALASKHVASFDDAADELHELLTRAVSTRLISDVPLGAFLSGGVDSSLVVALMKRATSHVRTFTIGFEDPAYDESSYAERVAKHLGVENTKLVLTPADVLRELPEVSKAFDEPMADYSSLPSIAVARLARQHVTVALTGDGADEAFGGYRYYNGTRAFESFSKWVPSTLRSAISKLGPLARSPRAQRAIRRVLASDPASYFGASGFYRGATADSSASRVLQPAPVKDAAHVVADYVRQFSTLRPTEAGMLWDATHTLPDAWLTKVDRTTMRFGLEARSPLLQRRILEFAFRLPLDYRIKWTAKKRVLRKVLGRHLPQDLIDRPKQGFTAPLKSWFAKELRDDLHARLSPKRLERFQVFDPLAVQELLREQTSGARDHTQMLWALYHLDRWYEDHVESAS
jgi:asparagine synthase (glutamine-hydrolysing)